MGLFFYFLKELVQAAHTPYLPEKVLLATLPMIYLRLDEVSKLT